MVVRFRALKKAKKQLLESLMTANRLAILANMAAQGRGLYAKAVSTKAIGVKEYHAIPRHDILRIYRLRKLQQMQPQINRSG